MMTLAKAPALVVGLAVALLATGVDARLRRQDGEEAVSKCPARDGRECSGHGLCQDHDNDGAHTCFCEPGYFGDACDRESCVTHCSAHGRCDITTKLCACAPGWTGLDCSVSACPNNCFGHGVCAQHNADASLRMCFCLPGWKGEACDRRVCPYDEHMVECSGHGRCGNGTCKCDDGFFGANCAVMLCNVPCVHGSCDCDPKKGQCTCTCDSGFVGPMCDRRCPGDCSGHGRCDNWGRCACAAGWTGVDCSRPQCPNDCSNHGICHANRTCTCEAGWKGADCSKLACPETCNWRTRQGECLFDRCVCYPGYTGEACETVLVAEKENPCGEDCYDHCRTHSECSMSQTQRFVFHHEGLGDTDVSVPDSGPIVNAEIDAHTGTAKDRQLGRKCYLQCLGKCFKACFKAVHEQSAEERAAAEEQLKHAVQTADGAEVVSPGITGDIVDAESHGADENGVDMEEVLEGLRRETSSDEGRG